jgi:hypothetical protein
MNALHDAIQLFFLAGTVTELRIPNTSRGTLSGYFSNLDALAKAAASWSGKAPGVYFTLNPVNPVLLARAQNRLVEYAQHTTGDLDIVTRYWLPLDFDPVRPSGISSTHAEHEAAVARARECLRWLHERGFTALILADSGNGAHVLARVDLPNDATSTALVKRCIEAVALRFGDGAVTVDLGVCNAARIWKCYGTLAAKGDSTPERPHRTASILEVADNLTPPPRELLEQLAALAPEEPLKQQYGNGQFDLPHWIAEHSLEVHGPHPWGVGKKWLFPVCPWNSDHTNRSAYLLQFANGAIAAGCHHNSCHGKDWHDLRDIVEPGWREKRSRSDAPGHAEERENPWLRAKPAPAFLAEEEKEFQGFAKDVLAPGVITLVASPKGIGKTQVIHALAVALGNQSGVFRGEKVRPCRVLLLDRENPRATVKKRLRAWGAAAAENLHVLTRQDAPVLRDRKAWEAFPVEQYDVLIVDSVGAATEGITEKEGRQNSEVLATLLDLAHRGVAILLLQNTEKTGTNIRGRGEWADRADIQYEVRDATGFTPSGKRSWWLELPADGAANWAERAARRKGRTEYRLAFIPAKFRLAAEPDPFCLEISLLEGEPWTLRDVTADILSAAQATLQAAEEAKTEATAAESLAELVRARSLEDPVLKTEAEQYLCGEGLSKRAARSVIADRADLWEMKPLPAGRGKGTPQALFPVAHTASQNSEWQSKSPSASPDESRAGETPYSATPGNSSGKVNMLAETAKEATSSDTFTSPPAKARMAEKNPQNTAKNAGYRDPFYFATDETEKHDEEAQEPWEDEL